MTVFQRGRSTRPLALPPLAASRALLATLLSSMLAACSGGDDAPAATASPAPVNAQQRPADPLFQYQWHLVNTGQLVRPDRWWRGTPGVDINVAPVWNQGFEGHGVTVAVVDDGIEIGHEDLRANIARGLSRNYLTDGGDPTPSIEERAHGTSVAGIIAAARNGLGGVGVAPGAKLAGLNLLLSRNESDLADALGVGITDGRIAVSNNSWGSANVAMPGMRDVIEEEIVRTGVDEGRNGKGIVYVFAAGNGNKDFNESTQPRLPHYGWSNFDRYVPTQALAVCAVNANGVASEYSSNGTTLLVCAPSDDMPDAHGVPQGPAITTTKPYGKYTHESGGTSSAAPMVSGVVALMLQANPELTWRDVRLVLARTARILPSMENDPGANWITTGATNPYTGNPYRYSTRYGFGLVDAQAAVSYAQRIKSVGGSNQAFWAQPCGGSVSEEDHAAAATGSVERTFKMSCGNRAVEFLEADIALEHPNFRALRVTLESPRGTKLLLSPEYSRCVASYENYGLPAEACSSEMFDHRFRTHAVTALDEPMSGDWTLRIEDALNTGEPIHLRSATLSIY